MELTDVGLGWNKDGNIATNSNGVSILMSNPTLLLNILRFHVQTEPGTYQLNRQVGMGLLQLIGRMNTKEDLLDIQREMNAYFSRNMTFVPYVIRATVTSEDLTSVSIKLTISGPTEDIDAQVLIDVDQGRVEYVMPFEEETVVLDDNLLSADDVNPYLTRLIDSNRQV